MHGWVVSLAASSRPLALADFREMGLICLCGVALAVLIGALLLRETGTERRS